MEGHATTLRKPPEAQESIKTAGIKPGPHNFYFLDNLMERCPCCFYLTFEHRGHYEICPICFWEDEGVSAEMDPDEESGPNSISLSRGRRNYNAFGACDIEFTQYVRIPLLHER